MGLYEVLTAKEIVKSHLLIGAVRQMQYKNNTKILIDKRKLDVLIRLGCPDKQLIEKIKTGKFTPTGDSLIDETLECLVDVKWFGNWGGNHNPSGKNQYTKSGQDGQVDHQDDGQDSGQVVDKDKDIDIDKEKDIKEYFNIFWEEFKPVKCNGKFVDKGSKKTAYEKFVKLMKKGESYEDIIRGTREYINHCQANNQLTCGATVFLNQERWKNDYGTTINGNTTGQHEQPCSILETYTEIAREYQ